MTPGHTAQIIGRNGSKWPSGDVFVPPVHHPTPGAAGAPGRRRRRRRGRRLRLPWRWRCQPRSAGGAGSASAGVNFQKICKTKKREISRLEIVKNDSRTHRTNHWQKWLQMAFWGRFCAARTPPHTGRCRRPRPAPAPAQGPAPAPALALALPTPQRRRRWQRQRRRPRQTTSRLANGAQYNVKEGKLPVRTPFPLLKL